MIYFKLALNNHLKGTFEFICLYMQLVHWEFLFSSSSRVVIFGICVHHIVIPSSFLQVEGPKSPEEMLTILQRVLEESSPVLVAARLEAEERRNNTRLREEQDAAYRAALEADRVNAFF